MKKALLSINPYKLLKLTKIPLIIFILICIGTLFASSDRFMDTQIIPKWLILCGGIILLGIYYSIQFLIKSGSSVSQAYNKTFISRIIITTTLFQALYGILQYFSIFPSSGSFTVTGSFDNPAGFAASLCVAFPFYMREMIKKRGIPKYLTIILIAIIIWAIILSGSRTGVFCLLVIGIFYGVRKIQISLKAKFISSLCICLMTIVCLYFIKKDSADGRLLIWKCSITMFSQHWLTGYGTGGFEAHYMDYQAAYLKTHPDSPYAMLADSVQHPFCEYLRIAVDYGILGIILLIGFAFYLLYCYFKYYSEDNETALQCWIAAGIFACFSYPLMYPFVWLLLIYSAYILICPHLKELLKYCSPKELRFTSLLFLILFCLAGIKLYTRTMAEIKWANIASLSLWGKTEQVLPQYEEIKSVLREDRYFLYNYSAELFQVGKYKESIMIANECRKVWADYDLEMLLGELQIELKQPEEAEKHYQLASYMCPNRFIPLHKLYTLYKEKGDITNARILAQTIVNKPVKVKSLTVTQIKYKMKEELNCLQVDH